GATQVVTCPGDQVEDIITTMTTGNSGGQTALIVTDTNNIILALPEGNSVDLEGAGLGFCRIWSVTYQGELTAALGDDAAAVDLASSCFALSNNFILAIRNNPDGGIITTSIGTTEFFTCPLDGGTGDTVTVINPTASASNLTFLVTDEDNVILEISDDPVLDFSNTELGICRIWSVTYEGLIFAQVGDTASTQRLATGCFSLSENFVTVNRIEAEGGTVATADGLTEVTTCPGDGI
ncbi:MAG: hypothetical protein AAF828_08135, partial [Bacteroidota bacterium]